MTGGGGTNNKNKPCLKSAQLLGSQFSILNMSLSGLSETLLLYGGSVEWTGTLVLYGAWGGGRGGVWQEATVSFESGL